VLQRLPKSEDARMPHGNELLVSGDRVCPVAKCATGFAAAGNCSLWLQVGYAALHSESGALPDQMIALAMDESPAVREVAYSTAGDWASDGNR
jgi:hypothetical protein